VEVDKDRLIHWLEELIRIPSITGNEEAIAAYVAQELSRMGYRPENKSNNVYCEIGSGAKSLLLNSHLDTVELGGQWRHDPFGAAMEDGKIFGRGASDDKGNIAAMLEIARIMKTKAPAGRLIFTFTTGEEFGTTLENKGSYLLAQFLKADKALVLEPQFDVPEKRLNIIYGCRGIENIRVRVKGKASHTGYPERGINAVSRTAKILERLEKLEFHKIFVAGEEVKTMPMPIQISGGADIFLVPAECSVLIHARTAPEDDRLVSQVEQVCREICGSDFEIEIPYSAPGYIDNSDDPLMGIMREQAGRFGYNSLTRFAGGRIDAAIFKNIGNIPSFCTGVGNRDQMHLVDESITVSDFVTCSEMLKDVVLAYLS
jgi:succinyl-diaminopimelate desuccinylase